MGHTKYEVRYNFAWTDVKRLIVKIHPDVLFLNQAELTAHVKALLVEVGWDKTTKIVSYCHYPALHINDTGEPCVDYSLNNGGFARAMQGLKKYAPLGELRAALFSCLLSVEYISHHLDIKMQVALNPYYLASILSSESQKTVSISGLML